MSPLSEKVEAIFQEANTKKYISKEVSNENYHYEMYQNPLNFKWHPGLKHAKRDYFASRMKQEVEF